MKLEQFTFREHSEKELRDALGTLLRPWPFDKYPEEADVVQDGLIEALRRRRTANRCPKCSKENPR